MSWLVEEQEDYDVICSPIGDLIDHPRDLCVCGPTVEEIIPGKFMHVHHALDGRE